MTVKKKSVRSKKISKTDLSLVEGSGESTHPHVDDDSLLFRNSYSQIEKVKSIEDLTLELGPMVKKFHDDVKRIAKSYGVTIRDHVSFEIIEGEVSNDN